MLSGAPGAGASELSPATPVPVRDHGDRVGCAPRGRRDAHVRRVVLTVPCRQVSRLCPQLSAAEQERLRNVVYQGIVCASLLLRRPLAEYYITNITDSGSHSPR